MRQPVTHVHQPALDEIRRFARDSDDGLETGGILLGHESGEIVEVTSAGGPGPAAIRQRRWFRRDVAHAQQLSNHAFDTDGSIWIGEWHTHPTGLAAPSELDTLSYTEMLADAELGFTQFVCFIVTQGHDEWATPLLWPWVVHHGGAVYAASVEVVASTDRPLGGGPLS